jgi:hypothetical protein
MAMPFSFRSWCSFNQYLFTQLTFISRRLHPWRNLSKYAYLAPDRKNFVLLGGGCQSSFDQKGLHSSVMNKLKNKGGVL